MEGGKITKVWANEVPGEEAWNFYPRSLDFLPKIQGPWQARKEACGKWAKEAVQTQIFLHM